jgi:hypothetical protein
MARFGSMVALVRRETVYATDSTPTAGADAVLFQEITWTPLEAEVVERPQVLPHYGNDPFSIVARRNRLAGPIDLAGSGALGTPPPYAALLRACGMAETITASTHVDYTPISTDGDSASIYHFLDGTRQIGLGARGDWGIDLTAGQIPRFTFDLQALYLAPTGVVLPTPTLTAWREPLPVSQANTPTVQIGANNMVLRQFTYTHGNRVVIRDMPNSRAIRIAGRAPRATMVVEAPDAVSPDLFALVGTLVPVSIVHGTTPGNVVDIQLGQARVLPNPRYSDVDNVAMLTLELRPEPTLAGNNEIRLRIR